MGIHIHRPMLLVDSLRDRLSYPSSDALLYLCNPIMLVRRSDTGLHLFCKIIRGAFLFLWDFPLAFLALLETWGGHLAVDPLAPDVEIILIPHDSLHRSCICVGHEAEASRFPTELVEYDH